MYLHGPEYNLHYPAGVLSTSIYDAHTTSTSSRCTLWVRYVFVGWGEARSPTKRGSKLQRSEQGEHVGLRASTQPTHKIYGKNENQI